MDWTSLMRGHPGAELVKIHVERHHPSSRHRTSYTPTGSSNPRSSVSPGSLERNSLPGALRVLLELALYFVAIAAAWLVWPTWLAVAATAVVVPALGTGSTSGWLRDPSRYGCNFGTPQVRVVEQLACQQGTHPCR